MYININYTNKRIGVVMRILNKKKESLENLLKALNFMKDCI